jgi:hypothetical protein
MSDVACSNSAEGVDVRLWIGAFAKLRKATVNFVVFLHLSAYRLSLNGFSQNLVFESVEDCRENPPDLQFGEE